MPWIPIDGRLNLSSLPSGRTTTRQPPSSSMGLPLASPPLLLLVLLLLPPLYPVHLRTLPMRGERGGEGGGLAPTGLVLRLLLPLLLRRRCCGRGRGLMVRGEEDGGERGLLMNFMPSLVSGKGGRETRRREDENAKSSQCI